MTESTQTDDMLAILNGDAGMPPRVDPAPEAAPSRDAELHVDLAPAPNPNPLARADAVHSTKAGGRGYKVRVRGLYYAPNPEGRGKIKKPYEVSINVAELKAAGSTIKNKLLLPALKRKYPEAVRHRTFHIIDVTPNSPDMPAPDSLAYMSRIQLEGYARQAKAPLDLTAFPMTDRGTTQLRESLIDFRQNTKGFGEREAERAKKRLEDAELAELNPELAVGSDAD